MVHKTLFCPEQITIPENLPEILKEYAKAAIRTQPYDLLLWSAGYFNCLQVGLPPPVKIHYEKNIINGLVTKEYLSVLIRQVGKGFYISRQVLENQWKVLCLPQDELLKYLSLCRMLHWPQVHWLKLFAIMVGSLNQRPSQTMVMLCELLTNNVEGAEPYIPMWMFEICYIAVAELDCSQKQEFIDGRKILPNGKLEDEMPMTDVPEICSPSVLKQAIFEECNKQYMEAVGQNILDEKGNNIPVNLSSNESECFEISKPHWKSVKNEDNHKDFDSVILLLRETQGIKINDFDGPDHITKQKVEKAKIKEQKLENERKKHAEKLYENYKIDDFKNQIKIFEKIGPPWSWLHEFATNCTIDKSYNFIDTDSIESDLTPPTSSDETFDFEKEKPIACTTTSTEETESIMSKSMQHENLEDDYEKLLQENNNKKLNKNTEDEFKPNFEIIHDKLIEIEAKHGDKIYQDDSVVELIRKEALNVLEGAGEMTTDRIDLIEIVKVLEQAYQNGINFANIDELMSYLKDVFPKLEIDSKSSNNLQHDILDIGLTNNTNEFQNQRESEMDDKISTSETLPLNKSDDSQLSDDIPIQLNINLDNVSVNNDTTPDDLTKSELSDHKMNEENTFKIERDIRDVFNATDVNSNLITGTVSKQEILGLIPKPEPNLSDLNQEVDTDKYAEGSIRSTITPSTSEVSFLGNINDDSSLLISSERSSTTTSTVVAHSPRNLSSSDQQENRKVRKNAFSCIIPPLPGIGPTISKKTIQDFLSFLKEKSRTQNGMVGPRNFKEPNCPNMIDAIWEN